jgi:predicted transcriptional regulator with HTH domain
VSEEDGVQFPIGSALAPKASSASEHNDMVIKHPALDIDTWKRNTPSHSAMACQHGGRTMVKVRFVEVEGDPEEVMRVSKLFGGSSEQVSGRAATSERSGATPVTTSANGASVTPDLVLRVLTRRELGPDPKKVFKALLKAGPKGMTSEEIARAVGIDRGQLAGLLGALGRRVANTEGWPTGARIIEKKRDENGSRRYHLPAVVRSALEKYDL